MTFLITYPEGKISNELRKKLLIADKVLYCPLRQLLPCSLKSEDKQLIKTSSAIGITSQFGLSVYTNQLLSLNTQAMFLLLSDKMRKKLIKKASNHLKIVVARSENQQGFMELIANLHLKSLTLLTGNIGAGNQLPKFVRKVQIYENKWSKASERVVIEKLRSEKIHRILVTSPSAYQRLKKIEVQIPDSFDSPIYYTLGPTTAKLINGDHQTAVTPIQTDQVLKRSLLKMIQDQMG
ncbi:uroporphyrinogen-III synthase [Lentilactobacillus raoultii]|uniref:Uroporphyrinogen-III synthase n=1 Tax=Lentilactobacillus raoultii TaxID=1987503 RepID=A0ABW3PKI0_9LACO|nr:hypothetical protein [Lentilactobacillus raoultii]